MRIIIWKTRELIFEGESVFPDCSLYQDVLKDTIQNYRVQQQ